MPELPEVESQVRDLRRRIVGRPIKKVWVGWTKTIARPGLVKFKKEIIGKRFKKIGRRGKFLLLELSGGLTMVAHLRMTGHFRLAPSSQSRSKKYWYLLPTDRFSRVAFMLDRAEVLHFSDIRKFGRLWLMPSPAVAKMTEIKALGPEPLDKNFKVVDFVSCFRGRKGMIKPLLLNQSCLAGIGNIYADESLFDARIHPKTRLEKLSDRDLKRLYKMVRANLAAAIKHKGSSIGEFINLNGQKGGQAHYLRVYGRAGQACAKTRDKRKCAGRVKRIIVGGRGTHICLACQKKL